MDANGRPRQTELVRDGVLDEPRRLRTSVDVARPFPRRHCAVHRLHRRVREERQAVLDFEDFAGVREFLGRFPVGPHRMEISAIERSVQPGVDRCGVDTAALSRVPRYLQDPGRAPRAPVVPRNDRDPALEAEDGFDAVGRLRPRGIEGREGPPRVWTVHDHCRLQAGQGDVHAILGSAGHLRRAVDAPCALPDVPPLLWRSQRDLSRRSPPGCLGRQLTKAEPRAARGVFDPALCDHERGPVAARSLRGGLSQHLSRASGRLPERLPDLDQARAPTRALHRGAELRGHGRGDQLDRQRIGSQLLSHQRREGGVCPLAHLDLVDLNQDAAFWGNREPGVEHAIPRLGRRTCRPALARWGLTPEDQRARGDARRLEELAAGQPAPGAHCPPSSRINSAAR